MDGDDARIFAAILKRSETGRAACGRMPPANDARCNIATHIRVVDLRGMRTPANTNFVGWGASHHGGLQMRVMIAYAIVGIFTLGIAANAQQSKWKDVDASLGRTGTVTAGIHRYAFPRSDLQVTLDGVVIKPALALGGWVAFQPTNDGVIMMGDLVLLQGEINPVMKVAIENGLKVTAIHNHILRANPLPFYMHISGRGDPMQVAAALHNALAASKTPLTRPTSAAPASKNDLDTDVLDRVMGAEAVGGVYHFAIARRDQITEGGTSLDPAGPLGVATALNFQPTGGGKAAITGDFVLTGNEVNPVIKALRSHDIEVSAIRGHMLTEEPRLILMYFWANDDELKLARGLRSAIDLTASRVNRN